MSTGRSTSAAVAAAALLGLAFSGCGGGGPTPASQVDGVVNSFGHTGDCNLLTSAARQEVSGASDVTGCQQALDQGSKPNFTIQTTTVSGSSATVKVNGSEGVYTIDLTKASGKWLIDNITQPGGSSSTTTSTPSTTTTTTVPSSSSSGSDSSGGSPVSIAGGVSITPAPGWTVDSQKSTSVDLKNQSDDAFAFATVGSAGTTDVTKALQSDISGDSQNPNYSDVQLSGTPSTQALSGGGPFDEFAGVNFTATGPNGESVRGLYVELLDTQSEGSAFFIGYADSDTAFQSARSDITAMANSLDNG